jgi:hypothetical protein
MKRFLPILFLFLFSFANAASIDNIYWEPKEPKPGDNITVYAEISGNVSKVKLQYCIGDACYFENMVKEGNIWKFVIDGSKVTKGTIEVNISIENGEKIFKTADIIVKEKKTPGFELLVMLAAIAMIIAKIKIRK